MRISDWSSDVCSSDLHRLQLPYILPPPELRRSAYVRSPRRLSPTLSHPHPLRQCCHPWNRARASNLRRTGEDRGTWWCPRLLPNRHLPAPPTDARTHQSVKVPKQTPPQKTKNGTR